MIANDNRDDGRRMILADDRSNCRLTSGDNDRREVSEKTEDKRSAPWKLQGTLIYCGMSSFLLYACLIWPWWHR